MTHVGGSVAVLMTAHNRRQQTVECIARVHAMSAARDLRLRVVLVDDGSTDGTADAVRQRYPDVDIISGSGNLYWNGGMRLAFEWALRSECEFFLFLNDDTHLHADALARLLSTYEGVGRGASIVAGATRDPSTGELSYGGWRSIGACAARLKKVGPSDVAQQCDTMNGNCVLIPRCVVDLVGLLDPAFTHAMGDLDYGFRAKRAGCALWVAPGYVGTCLANPGKGSWRDPALGLGERWRRLLGPKGLPVSEWRVFTRRYAGTWWPLYWAGPYVKFWIRALAALRS